MFRFLLPVAILLVASCADEDAPPKQQYRDPQVAQALDDPLMTDPDLSSGNEAAAALTVSSDASLPILPATPEAIASARAEAAALVGGVERLAAPPRPDGKVVPLAGDSLASHVAVLDGGRPCSDRLDHSAVWAARMPEAFPVYPRGATVDAAGSDAPGCWVRSVRFMTPVPADEVLAFYWARARQAGFRTVHMREGETHVLAGSGAALTFDVRVREQVDSTLIRVATMER